MISTNTIIGGGIHSTVSNVSCEEPSPGVLSNDFGNDGGIKMMITKHNKTIRGNTGTTGFSVSDRVNSAATTTTSIAARLEKPLFDGSTVVAKRLLDFSVVLTFGLACPVLGLAVAFSVYANALIWRLMIGKFLSSVGENNTYAFFRLEKSSEGLVRGAVAGLNIAVISICVFWSVMLFDMVADLYGDHAGIVFIVVVMVGFPMVLYAGFAAFDYITRSHSHSTRDDIFLQQHNHNPTTNNNTTYNTTTNNNTNNNKCNTIPGSKLNYEIDILDNSSSLTYRTSPDTRNPMNNQPYSQHSLHQAAIGADIWEQHQQRQRRNQAAVVTVDHNSEFL